MPPAEVLEGDELAFRSGGGNDRIFGLGGDDVIGGGGGSDTLGGGSRRLTLFRV